MVSFAFGTAPTNPRTSNTPVSRIGIFHSNTRDCRTLASTKTVSNRKDAPASATASDAAETPPNPDQCTTFVRGSIARASSSKRSRRTVQS